MGNRNRTAAVVGVVGVAVAVAALPPVAAGGSVVESAGGGSTGSAAAPAEPGSRIAFSRLLCSDFGHEDGCQGPMRLYVTDADGTDKRRLPDGYGPVWSPNGRWIAVESSHGIQVVNADGTGVKSLAAGPLVSNPAWSPDSQWIMYEDWLSTPPFWTELYRIRPDGTGKRRLAVGDYPVWSPDGRRIAFRRVTWTATGGQFTHTKVMNADGTGVKLLDVAPGAYWSAPVWSPDSRWIMWDQEFQGGGAADDRRYGLFAIHPDGTGKRRLAAGSSPVWSPDGRRIAFRSYDRGLRSYLAVMDADGSHVKRVKHAYSAPLWSPDGRWITFHRSVGSPSSRRRYEVWVVRADGTHLHKLSRGVPWAWSPNGRRIVFTHYTGDRGILKVMDLNGGHMQRVTPSRQYDYYQHAAWSGAAPTRTTITARPHTVAKGAPVTLSGTVTKTGIPLPTATVRIRFKKTGAHRFTTVSTLTTSVAGRYRATETASSSGTWQAVHPATPATRSSSATDKITLRR